MMSTVDKIRSFIIELMFPSFCLGCRREGIFICVDCRATLDILAYNYCLCGKNPLRLPPGATVGTCKSCAGGALEGVYSAVPYQERFLTKKIIYSFKEKPYVKGVALAMANIIAEHLVLSGNNADRVWHGSVMAAVPMERAAVRRRGYNQAEVLAHELSLITKTEVVEGNLVKTKKTPPQKKLTKEEREKNLNGAFAVKNPTLFAGKKVFLVDDVYTTGSTMKACAAVLKSAGAREVWGIAFAREG